MAAQDRYFSTDIVNGIYEGGDFPPAPHYKFLAAMDEPSLSVGDVRAETYRIIWLRSFDPPMVFRLIVLPDGTAILITKKTNGEGGYEPGKMVLNKETTIDKQETQELLKALKMTNFWTLPTFLSDFEVGFDGAHWVLEGKNGREYHLVDRWSGGEIRDWALLLMNMSGENLRPIY